MSLATQVASLPHPPSAMKFNGVYLEDKISGYYTEKVEGRYNSSIDITTQDITGVDGTDFIRKRYETRELSVHYSIYADTKIELHDKESQVKRYTRESQAQIIFDDEPQYYWIGTVSQVESEGIDATGSGIFVSNGTITIALDDPFKYSITTKEFKASESNGVMALTIKNNGTVPVPIDYTIVHGSDGNSENGYVGITSSEGIIQLGDIHETDYATGTNTWTTTVPAETVISFDDVLKAPSDGNTTDGGVVVDLSMQTQNGVVYWDGSKNPAMTVSGITDRTGLTNKNAKRPQDMHWDNKTHVAQKTVAAKTGASTFYAWFDHWFVDGGYAINDKTGASYGKTGYQSVAFLTADNRVIAEIRLIKYDQNTNRAAAYLILNGQVKNEFTFSATEDAGRNPFPVNGGMDDFYKDGPNARFFYWGSYFSYSDAAIASMVCTKVRFRIGFVANDVANNMYRRYGNDAVYPPVPLSLNYLRHFDMRNTPTTQTHTSTYTYDVANRYQPGCIIHIDGASSKVYVNGLPKASEEVTGSKYFLAPPGETRVEFTVSPFCTTHPTITATIREKFL